MKCVMMTGVTGNMGWAGFKEMYKDEQLEFRLLVRHSKKNIKLLAPYAEDPRVKVIWGDMLDYEKVHEAVTGADYVFHLGGMVSPAAEYFPEKTLKVNVTSAEIIVKAIIAQKNRDEIKAIYIGSVAEYGDRMQPIQWGRSGDPMRASAFDMYSVSKCRAEKFFIDSGLKNWLVLRQSGILHPGILKIINATVFHVPVRGMLEWTTLDDSARVMAGVVKDGLPEEFWNNVYNISSGPDYRMTNYEFESRIFSTLGMGSVEKIFEPQWFATKNFHGMWYTDGDVLENYLHFRENLPVEDYFRRMKKQMPWYFNLAFLAPTCLVKKFISRYAFEEGQGTQSWLDDPEKMKAFYGSVEEYRAIRSWDDIRPPYIEKDLEKAEAAGEVRKLDHGYDESRSIYDLSSDEIQAAAAFRGGKFLGPEQLLGQKGALFEWECEHGHHFIASLEFVLLAGGWCLDCGLDSFEDTVSPENRFSSQVL